jgi:hypothetical protein
MLDSFDAEGIVRSLGRESLGAKLVEIPIMPRRIHFQAGSIAKSRRRATRKAPLLSSGTTVVSNTSLRASATTATPAVTSTIYRISTPHRRLLRNRPVIVPSAQFSSGPRTFRTP